MTFSKLWQKGHNLLLENDIVNDTKGHNILNDSFAHKPDGLLVFLLEMDRIFPVENLVLHILCSSHTATCTR